MAPHAHRELRIFLPIVAWISLLGVTAAEESPPVDDPRWHSPPTFENDVQPIFARLCFDCHGEQAQESQFDARSVSELLRGGENGAAIIPGDPQGSLLLDLITSGQMPPTEEDRLSAEEIEIVRRWIIAGSPASEAIRVLPSHAQVTEEDRRFWAFQPPRPQEPPQVQQKPLVRTPIDRFLLAKLEEKGLCFSPQADRRALIRRATFDLTGLPPEPADVQAFVEDSRPDAYEQLIDRLLRSPHYGERWGRHWLDAAGYVDGKLDNDLGSIYPNQNIWRYRDYVIESLNEDKPFDQFLTEQIAGDEMVDWRSAEHFDARVIKLLTATGFLRNVDDHTDFPQYGIEKRYEVVNETLDMFSTAVLGLTMECCRCHNHKYDPLPQRDYYRLMACFEPALNVHAWKPPKERFLVDVSAKDQAAVDQHNAQIDQQIEALTKREREIRDQAGQRLRDARAAAVPEPIRADVVAALARNPEQRSEIQKYLAEKFASIAAITDAEIDASLTEAEHSALRGSTEQRTVLGGQKKTYGVIQAMWDVGSPPTSRVHRRGNVHAPGVLVQAGFPEILQPPGTVAAAVAPQPLGPNEMPRQTSGRRLALARWLTDPAHPLTARVFVNRVWHHHFGRGILETLGNFGRSGSLPSHPELLDWLAVDFIEHGWSIKRLHRQIMLSTAYMQSSRRASFEPAQQIDPENRLLWRMNLRRLEAEIVRDALLAVSGALDPTAGGPPVEITNPADGLSEAKGAPTATSGNRRSVYLFARRVYPLKFLEIFDAPIMPVNCTQRTSSATVLQSLALLNSEFMFARAEQFARRIETASGLEQGACVKTGFLFALAREPGETEFAKSLEFLAQQQQMYASPAVQADAAQQMALVDFCHMLLSANEFFYVE